jgi:predicted lipid-binding transport protein (Tim44 family)
MKRRVPAFLAACLALAVALAPGLADARAGSGSSMGSRGMRTYSAPPPTNTSPFTAAPMQRSMTPQAPAAPSYAPSPSMNPGYAQPYRAGSPFMSGLLGGLVGAGIGGLLFGHGMFGGIGGFGSIIGLLIQLLILFFIVRLVLRLVFSRQPAFAGFGSYARNATPPPGAGQVRNAGPGAGPGAPPVTITRTDYEAFERLLKDVQAAWSAQDLNRLRGLATPEMVGYFGEQLAEQSSQGVRNTVTDVKLEQGDLAEAWSEGSREYATVAMRFSMLDATRDQSGRVVAGSDRERTQATELWTFLRSPGGRWVLSAIQQAR